MSWNEYFIKTQKRKLRPLFLKALTFLNKQKPLHRFAIELGCGLGIETQELAKQGWKLLAIDGQEASVKRINKIIYDFPNLDISVKLQNFEEILSLPQADLIYSYHSLPFCKQDYFFPLLKTISEAVKSKGYFVGSFFGCHDDWVKLRQCSGIKKTELENCFSSFNILYLHEYQKKEAPAIETRLKNWHVFELIAQKH